MRKISGIVIKANQRGKELGFPTANIAYYGNFPDGIFISKTTVKNITYKSLTFIGKAETFNDKDRYIETFILDFDEDIYGQEIEIEILKKLRDSVKFTTVEALIDQMNNDVLDAKKFFKLDN